MNDFQQKLMDSFPNLFEKDENGNLIPPRCGIYCPVGWENLVFTLCESINIKLERGNVIYDREEKIYKSTEIKPVKILQIKEKFAGLRFYHTSDDPYINGLVNMAENMSFNICEVTGNKGVPCSNGSWIKTLSLETIKQNEQFKEYTPH